MHLGVFLCILLCVCVCVYTRTCFVGEREYTESHALVKAPDMWEFIWRAEAGVCKLYKAEQETQFPSLGLQKKKNDQRTVMFYFFRPLRECLLHCVRVCHGGRGAMSMYVRAFHLWRADAPVQAPCLGMGWGIGVVVIMYNPDRPQANC